MPCNAIATARAQVAQESLRKLLTDELVSVVVFDYLRLKYKDLILREDATWSGVAFIMGGTYRIHILNGAVRVNGGWSGEITTACAAIAIDLTSFLTKTAGLIFQQKTRQAVASRYAISEEQRSPNGALVLSVEL
jgi:hypothetical protein